MPAMQVSLTACSGHLKSGRCLERPTRHRGCVVMASVGPGPRPVERSPASSRATNAASTAQSTSRDWLIGTESAAVAPKSGVVQALKANRGVRFIRSESRRLGERRLAAFLSALALTALAVYGQDLIGQMGQLTKLPVEEIDGIIYFIICFNAVSLVLPKSRYSK